MSVFVEIEESWLEARRSGGESGKMSIGHPSSRLHVTSMLAKAAQQHPDRVATIDCETGVRRTYKETCDRVARFAGALQKAGVSPGGRVALVSMNSSRYLEIFFACSWAGAIVVPLNIRLAPMEIVEQVNDCEAEILIVDDTFKAILGAVKGKVPSVKHFLFAGQGSTPADCSLNYEELIKSTAPVVDALRGGDDIFGLMYTGGTTGKAKGVKLTHTNLFVNALGHVAMLNYTCDSLYLHSAPMFHMADNSSTFGITMAGGTHAFIPKFDPLEMLKAIEKFKVNKAMMVPAMIAIMLQVPGSEKYDCSSLESIIYGASPMPEALLAPAMAKFPKAKFSQGYGMTETSPAICMLTPEFHTQGNPKMRSVGRPVPWVEVRVVNKQNQECKRGEIGEIVTRGPHVMAGYWRMEEKTASTIDTQGWLHTEDAGYMDEDGFVFLVDRIKDMIITGGENVYAAEVENAVMKFPDIAMCAVIGTPDAKFGELVTAVVVPQEGKQIDGDALMKHCRGLIAAYKCPRKVVIKKELPMSGAGKILKNKLREEMKTTTFGSKL